MRRVASLFCEAMHLEMGYKDRGVKLMSKGNGFGFLQKTKGDALLLEPFFGSNKEDCDRFDYCKFQAVIRDTIEFYKTL